MDKTLLKTIGFISLGVITGGGLGKITKEGLFDDAYARPVMEIISRGQEPIDIHNIPNSVLIKTSEKFEKEHGQPNWSCEFMVAFSGMTDGRERLLTKLKNNKEKISVTEKEKQTINLLIQKIEENNNQDWFQRNALMLIGMMIGAGLAGMITLAVLFEDDKYKRYGV